MAQVRIGGRYLEIPEEEGGSFVVQEAEHSPHRASFQTTEYVFHLPDPRVDVRVYEEPPLWVLEDHPQANHTREIVSERTAHAGEFMVGPGGPLERWERYMSQRLEERGETAHRGRITFAEHEERLAHRATQKREKWGYFSESHAAHLAKKYQEYRQRDQTLAKQLVAEGDGAALREKRDSIPHAAVREERAMPKNAVFPSGTRVWFKNVFKPLSRIEPPALKGTVVQLKSSNSSRAAMSHPEGHTLVCLDKPRPGCDAFDDRVGKGHGAWIATSYLRVLEKGGAEEFLEVPRHIGVCAPKAFLHEKVCFDTGSVGRVLRFANESKTAIAVAWKNVTAEALWSTDVGGTRYENCCYNVPISALNWCYFDPTTFRIRSQWFTALTPYDEGDLLLYTGEKPVLVPGSRHNRVVAKGTLLRFAGYDSSHGLILGSVAGGMSPSHLGMSVSVRRGDVAPFDGPYLPPQAAVEVVAEVVFRKKNLQGQKGKVILPTDADGDAGVEFCEDIGAGSLDGAGREGRCLYIPTSALKRVDVAG